MPSPGFVFYVQVFSTAASGSLSYTLAIVAAGQISYPRFYMFAIFGHSESLTIMVRKNFSSMAALIEFYLSALIYSIFVIVI